EYYTNEALMLRQLTDARVSFIRSDGTVIGDSDYEVRDMDNHLDREEVVEALEHGVGRSVRASETIKQNMLYVALSVTDEGNAQPYIIRLAMNLGQVERSADQLTLVLIVGLLV